MKNGFMDLQQLLLENESEFLDFKREFHTSNVRLLHDILCLSNSYTTKDRYIVFGVADDKTVYGIASDPNKKTEANIQDFLRQSRLNRIPTVRLNFQTHEGHEIGILEIVNRPDKPFFVTEDRREGSDTLRGGVVYTRIGSTNIPMNSSAREEHIELMWRERFGIGLDPLEKFEKLLEQKDKWVKLEGDNYIYHQDSPEFTVRDGKEINRDFVEAWTEKFPDPDASSYEVEIRYHTTILKKFLFVSCDGGRYSLPLPRRKGGKFFIDSNSLEYKVAGLYKQYYSLEEAFSFCGVEVQ